MSSALMRREGEATVNEISATIDLIKWLLALIVALVGVLFSICLWEIRQLRKSMHDLRNDLPARIVQWHEIMERKRSP
jgi:hypothetical protein